MSYSNDLIKFTLTHYVDIMNGKITPDEMGDFCKSAGRRNPLETALIWKADIDKAIISLHDRKTGWKEALNDGMSDSMILHLSRSKYICDMQRDLISMCIMRDCGKICKQTGWMICNGTAVRRPHNCPNEGIITRMRKYLNSKNRDEKGRFTKQLKGMK